MWGAKEVKLVAVKGLTLKGCNHSILVLNQTDKSPNYLCNLLHSKLQGRPLPMPLSQGFWGELFPESFEVYILPRKSRFIDKMRLGQYFHNRKNLMLLDSPILLLPPPLASEDSSLKLIPGLGKYSCLTLRQNYKFIHEFAL